MDLWGNKIKHKNVIETHRYNNTQFLLMNEIYKNNKNAEQNELARMV